jgi:hypothetical protein
MDEEWRKDFEVFLLHIGPRLSPNHSLDRIDPHGAYEPGNVRWATDKQQARNKKDTKFVKHPKTGERVKAADLAEELKITYQQLRHRMIDAGEW